MPQRKQRRGAMIMGLLEIRTSQHQHQALPFSLPVVRCYQLRFGPVSM